MRIGLAVRLITPRPDNHDSAPIARLAVGRRRWEVKTIGLSRVPFASSWRVAQYVERAADGVGVANDLRAGLDRECHVRRDFHEALEHVDGVGVEGAVRGDRIGPVDDRLAAPCLKRGHVAVRAEGAGVAAAHRGHPVSIGGVGLQPAVIECSRVR